MKDLYSTVSISMITETYSTMQVLPHSTPWTQFRGHFLNRLSLKKWHQQQAEANIDLESRRPNESKDSNCYKILEAVDILRAVRQMEPATRLTWLGPADLNMFFDEDAFPPCYQRLACIKVLVFGIKCTRGLEGANRCCCWCPWPEKLNIPLSTALYISNLSYRNFY